ncbi:transcriptional regulator [Micromonospora fulviviridis]|uniref:helix-turn-helix domain-containing protein n=1 Tax=Micromonospora fulviviridis TaxID=47860 RepID=UPI001664BD11|nr:helix-turn-helix transcriptional regulator [Micromonospora fulviviridis]GGR86193.1 transcriptional regulator [Micromonospora fulviviridis]
MGTPLGDFVRAKRDSLQPESFGLPDRGRRRSPGLTRAEVATRSGISVEYLTRIEQGRDRNPSHSVLHALADGLSLDAGEREHLRYLAKITGGACPGHRPPAPPNREVRPTVRETLRLLEPGVAFVTNRLGDVLAYTGGFELVMSGIGLLDADVPNLTRYVFTDSRARTVFPDWDQVADEQAFDLRLGPSAETSEWFTVQLAPVAGQEFTRRLRQHLPPPQVPLRLGHPVVGELRWHREKLELSSTDAQELVVLLPADEATAQAVERLRHRRHGALRAVG